MSGRHNVTRNCRLVFPIASYGVRHAVLYNEKSALSRYGSWDHPATQPADKAGSRYWNCSDCIIPTRHSSALCLSHWPFCRWRSYFSPLDFLVSPSYCALRSAPLNWLDCCSKKKDNLLSLSHKRPQRTSPKLSRRNWPFANVAKLVRHAIRRTLNGGKSNSKRRWRLSSKN